MKAYPALEIRGADPDRLAIAIDDLSAAAIEDRDDSVRVFFSTTSERDHARSVLAPEFDLSALDVADEDWARRSQADLQPVTVGRLTISPRLTASAPPALPDGPGSFGEAASAACSESRAPSPCLIVITPSMGFGTGHHATTRLCLAALQALDLKDKFVLDVGTGSGVLALAADRLGAARALGIDCDADAIRSAEENLGLNPAVRHVTFAVVDARATALPQADVVTANLTGALLIQAAEALLVAVRNGGTLIASGLQSVEREEVVRALVGEGSAHVMWEVEEDGWVGLAVKKA